MHRIRTALLDLAMEAPTTRSVILPVTHQAAGWSKLPKGWTQESVDKFWGTLTGDSKHKVTKCIERMKDKPGFDDPGAFCASLADQVEGSTDWRKGPRDKKAAGKNPPWWNGPLGQLVWDLASSGTRWSKAPTKAGDPNPVRLNGYNYLWGSDKGLIETLPPMDRSEELPDKVRLTPEGVAQARAMKPVRDHAEKVNRALKDLRKLMESLDRKYPEAQLSFGYLGNVEMGGRDDRSWYVFSKLSRPGSGGHDSFKWGGYRTEDAPEFLAKYRSQLDGLVAKAVAENAGPYKGPAPYPRYAMQKRAYFSVMLQPGATKWQHPSKVLSRGAFKSEREAHQWAAKNIPGESYTVQEFDDPEVIEKAMLEVARAVKDAGSQGVRVDRLPAVGVREMLAEKVVEAERGYLYPRQPAFDRWVKSLRGVRLANGDMLQYFADNPDKLEEKLERDAKKKGKRAKVAVGVRRVEALNRYNAPEMLAALLKALNLAGLDDTVEQLRRLKVPQLINDAWMERER